MNMKNQNFKKYSEKNRPSLDISSQLQRLTKETKIYRKRVEKIYGCEIEVFERANGGGGEGVT